MDLELQRNTTLSPQVLSDRAARAAQEILIEGESANTRASYQSAIRYWCAWFEARYGGTLPLPVPVPVVVQFVVDHVTRAKGSHTISELPKAIDKKLVDAGAKGSLGPLSMNTVRHRLSVISQVHALRKLDPNPCKDPALALLMSRARRAAAKRGDTVKKKPAATKDPLLAMVATCDTSLKGLRDRALLLFGWSSGGRRRSEITAADMANLRRLGPTEFAYRLTHSKTQQSGDTAASVDKPILDEAGAALAAWISAAAISEGPIFRRLWKSRVGGALSPAAVRAIVIARAKLAGVEGSWSAHSLRSGFVTECGRQRIPLGEVMALSNHSHVGSVVGYYRTGELSKSSGARLLSQK